ncbi:unnamed protein product [Nippostrongylus brasiliensis]|uniref:PDZ domain-containing protein n=1 Tax=Nippostrongylus brasiliensis TaxID=27835 RepID=A0A158R0L6_NIPBR|nr:unnamed protein product [Nippostrongylus brasiliensis]
MSMIPFRSAYFVKFSASQHRFMMRMRQWKSTLRHENTIQAMPDVCVEGREPPPPLKQTSDATIERFEMVTRSDSSDGDAAGMRFEVNLVKDKASGLGLTLVDGNLNGVKGVYVKSVAENGAGMRAVSVSRTPPPPRRAANRRQRAVSDFGAIGDTLPALDSDNVINIKAISGLHLDESDEEQGEYRLPTTSMYSFENHYDDDSPTSPSDKVRKSNLEWTDELEEVGEENETDDDIVDVQLERNEMGSLGVQIASVSGRVCIKQLTAEPAISHPDLRVGDALIYVNGEPVANKSHQEVVSMLRSGGNLVTLGLRREPQKNGNIITAVLEKKPEGSLGNPEVLSEATPIQLCRLQFLLAQCKICTSRIFISGLSLAKRTGSDGIFIRMIAANSAAAMEDGESVTDLTPTAILERLRLIQGAVHITVSRDPH